jgi:hypothetical protein
MGPVDEPDRHRLHPDLQVDYGCTVVGTLVLFGIPGLAMIGWALREILPAKDPREAFAAALGPLFFGPVLLATCVLLSRSARWYRRCSAVFHGHSAVPMRVHAVRNERGGLFLELHNMGDPHLREAQVRIQAQVPTWDVSDLDGQVVNVRMDDDPQGPVVVETARGLLWPAPMSRRQNRIEGRLR